MRVGRDEIKVKVQKGDGGKKAKKRGQGTERGRRKREV